MYIKSFPGKAIVTKHSFPEECREKIRSKPSQTENYKYCYPGKATFTKPRMKPSLPKTPKENEEQTIISTGRHYVYWNAAWGWFSSSIDGNNSAGHLFAQNMNTVA